MEIKLIGRGHAVETEPEAWAGGVAIVSATCGIATENGWGTDRVAVLESEERVGENVRPWVPVATFDRDGERKLTLPPGRYRWRASQGTRDASPLTFAVDVQPRLPA